MTTRGACFVVAIFAVVFTASITIFPAHAWASDPHSGNGSGSDIVTSVPRVMNYQGILNDSAGDPVADSIYSITFRLFDTDIGGTSLWEQASPCTTSNGIFSAVFSNVNLPFDVDYWLEIEVGSEILDPRQKMSMVGYAAAADTADFARTAAGGGWVENGNTITLETSTDSVGIGTDAPSEKLHVEGNLYVSGTATIGTGHEVEGTGSFIAGYANGVMGNLDVVSGGTDNIVEGDNSTIGGGYSNGISGNNSIIAGGHNNEINADHSTIAGGENNTVSNHHSFIGGGSGNTASNYGSTISGGVNNSATVFGSSVGGGFNNHSGSDYSVVAGGIGNQVTEPNGSIGGGVDNYLEGESGVIAGGRSNQNFGTNGVIGGGYQHLMRGDYSGILGGYADTITTTARYSYLFGIGSKLTEDSTFMVDMPHIRFGDETTGYAFPDSDGSAGRIMATDGTGLLSWIDPGSLSGWTDDGLSVRLENPADNVGIGTPAPTEKLDVTGNVKISGKVTVGPSNTNSGTDSYVFGNSNSLTANNSVIGGGAGNSVSGNSSVISGGSGNQAPAPNAVIGGGSSNQNGGQYGTISGGQSNIISSGQNSSVGGGYNNWVYSEGGVVGGGAGNHISSSTYGTISGGYGNNISGGDYNFIGGGRWNILNGGISSICGGENNVNYGSAATILGGSNNTIGSGAVYAMVFGYNINLSSSYRTVLYNASAPGALGINRDSGIAAPIHVGTNAGNGNGAYLSPTGTWVSTSSRSKKDNFRPFEKNDLFSKIKNLDVESWQYIGSSETHVGPYAEQFNATFGTSTVMLDGTVNNQGIAASDVAGVALAGVKELIQENQELKDMISQLEKRIEDLENK